MVRDVICQRGDPTAMVHTDRPSIDDVRVHKKIQNTGGQSFLGAVIPFHHISRPADCYDVILCTRAVKPRRYTSKTTDCTFELHDEVRHVLRKGRAKNADVSLRHPSNEVPAHPSRNLGDAPYTAVAVVSLHRVVLFA